MTSRDFIYWLQGYLEIADPEEIDGAQLDTIEHHGQVLFIDFVCDDNNHQKVLDKIHAEGPKHPFNDGTPPVYRC